MFGYGVCVVAVMLLIMSVLFMFSFSMESSQEDNSCYECGFEPMSLARNVFSYRFFLLSILFLIFDVEITLILPVPYLMEGVISSIVLYIFLFILLVGVVYEYCYGSLDWV